MGSGGSQTKVIHPTWMLWQSFGGVTIMVTAKVAGAVMTMGRGFVCQNGEVSSTCLLGCIHSIGIASCKIMNYSFSNIKHIFIT